ncbi:glycosyltransferase [Parvularcula sp. ZS-1/3]|uniref:Glycosyltransferase n=2 Tax=Parvularcula mediterranea TaxID=2732508 RepID=A0A7Y3RIS8_9PROT|nr:glycosyltransferase [Parvularcula mediterranea]
MRILIFTRHYPPLLSGGARRPFLLAQGLRAAGADVRIVAPALPEGEPGLALGHPVLKPTAASETGHAAPSLRARMRLALLVPDPELPWVVRNARRIKEHARSYRPDVVLTTSPPESIHLGGAWLAGALDVPWVADVRDHWLLAPLMEERTFSLRRHVEGFLARRLLQRASLITAAERSMQREMRVYAPTVPTLHLPQPGPALLKATPVPSGRVFRVLHTGGFTTSHAERDIGPALDLVAEVRASAPHVHFLFQGALTSEERERASRVEGLTIKPPVSLVESWAEQQQASALLLVAADGAIMPPGKLSEYRAAGRPIATLGGSGWTAREGLDADPAQALIGWANGTREFPEGLAPPPSGADVAKTLLEAVGRL